jgi:hypothetical protein
MPFDDHPRDALRRSRTLASTLLVVLACAPQASESAQQLGVSNARSVYPVDPRVQVDDKKLDPTSAGSVNARVLNAVAYARYGVQSIANDDGEAVSEDPKAVVLALSALGAKSGIAPTRVASLYNIEATAAEREPLRVHVLQGAHGLGSETPLSSVGARIVDLQAQLRACTRKEPGARQAPTAEACCQALATPWFLLDSASKMEAPARTAWQQEAVAGTVFSEMPSRRLAEASAEAGTDTAAKLQPFRHQSIKAFLSVCHPIVRHAPQTLVELKTRYGDYAKGERWTTELHPISMAKMAARRIYRSWDTKVSVAESIGESCEVRETEVIVERANGILDFFSYGQAGTQELHGFFPAKLRVDAIKYTPDSCMGCHYKLDSRTFTVRMPSYKALGLTLRSNQGEPQWVDGSACAHKGESIVWHEKP